MLILAIDTSTSIGTMALYDSKKGLVGEITLNVKQNHSNQIMIILDTLLKLTDIDKKDIDKIAVSIGPGSFTGIRIGVGLAKGLAYSLKKPLAGINELDLLASICLEEKNIVSILDARKERVFCGKYKTENGILKLQEEYVADELRTILDEIKEKTIFVGDGAVIYKEIIKEKLGDLAKFKLNSINVPRASIIAELAIEKEDNLFTLEPYYISKPQAEREKEAKNKGN